MKTFFARLGRIGITAHEEAEVSLVVLPRWHAHPDNVSVSAKPGSIIIMTKTPRRHCRTGFRTHIAVRPASGLPSVIHARRRRHRWGRNPCKRKWGRRLLRAFSHCLPHRPFSPRDRALSLGLFISFPGFTRLDVQEFAEFAGTIARTVPMDRLLVRDRRALLGSVPYRGKRNEAGLRRGLPREHWLK